MTRRTNRRLLVPALLILAAGHPVSVFAQSDVPVGDPTAPGSQAPPAPAPEAAAPAPAQPEPAAATPPPAVTPPPPDVTSAPLPVTAPTVPPAPAPLPEGIEFNFKDVPFDQVLDFMARETGLPVIREADAPKSGLTFIGASRYSLDEAMDVLNRLLFMHGVQLRREDRYLLLTKAEEMRAFGQVVGKIPEDIGSAEVITTVVPLNNAVAAPLAEQLKGMVSKFGGITALPQQNALIIVDTAAMCRRLRGVIEQLDAERPRDSEFKLFALKHAKADKVHAALKGLIAERKQVTFIDQQGRKTTVQDDQIEGLSIQADERTNSIIAVGPKPRLEVVGELVAILDQPDGANDGREMLTFALAGVGADEAAGSVSRLFQQRGPGGGEPGSRPTVLPLPAQGKLTVIGTAEQLALVAALIAEVDPGAAPTTRPSDGSAPSAVPETRAAVLRTKHLSAAAAQNLVARLLSPRQVGVLRYTQGGDERSLVVSGPAADVAAFEKLVQGLDVAAEKDREVRQVRIASGDPAQVLARTESLYKQSTRAETELVAASLEGESRMVTLVGSTQGLSAFTDLLKSVESSVVVERETRSIVLKQAKPSLVAGRLAQLARTLLEPSDGSVFVEPRIDAIDETRTLVVRARPADLSAIEAIAVSIDGATVRDATFRVLMVPAESLAQVRSRATEIEREQIASLPNAAAVQVIEDKDRGALLVSGDAEGVARYGRIVEELSRLAAKPVVQVLELKFVESGPTALAINQSLAPLGGVGPAGGKVSISSAEGSNALVISGSATDVQMVEDIARSLDLEGNKPGAVSVATVQMKHARAEAIAPIVQQLLQRDQPVLPPQFRPGSRVPVAAAEQARTLVPVKVAADRRLNVVVVSGPRESVEVAKQVIADLDVDMSVTPQGAARVVRVLTLENADASETALSVQAIFQDDASGVAAEPVPVVRVDRASNSLVVRATDKQLASIEELVKGLDKATNAASRDMRLIGVDRSKADAQMLAEALRRLLAQRGATKVEVISVDELLAPKDEKKQGSDARPVGGEVTPLRGAQANALAAWVAAMALAAVDQPEKIAEDGVTIAVDEATNSLIISGSSRAVDRAVALAAELQRQMPAEPMRLRIVTLPEGVDANIITSIVNQTAGQIGQASAQNPGGFTSRVSVQADPQGGALIVSANDTDFSTLGELIAAVSKPMPGSTLTIKVYPLTNTNAGRVQRAVADLFSPAPRGRQAQRVLQLAFDGGEGPGGRSLRVDPSTVRVTADPSGRSLVVAAPADAMPLIDRFISLLDQAPMQDQLAIRRFALGNARAEQVSPMLQQAFEAARQLTPDAPRASVLTDPRTNAVLITGTDVHHKDAEKLLAQLDLPAEADGSVTAIIPLHVTRPSTAQRIVEAAIVGNDPAKREKLRLTAADESNVLVVRAPQEMIDETKRIVAQIDSSDVAGLPVRSVKLERADADGVALALQKFYDDRAKAGSKPNQPARQRQVAVVGDRRSGSVVIAASEEDFAQIQSLIATFDAPSSRQDMQFRIIPLQHARVAEIRTTVEGVVDEVKYPANFWSGRGNRPSQDDTLSAQFNDRSNSVVLFGQGEAFDTIEKIIQALDTPQVAGAKLIVRAVKLKNASPQTVGPAIQSAMTTPGWSWWRGNDPDGVRVEVDRRAGVLLMIGREDRVLQAEQYAAELDTASDVVDRAVETIQLTYANADRIAASLSRFFEGRDRGAGLERSLVSVIGSPEGNVLIVSASKEDVALVRGFITQMDQPEESEGRVRELYRLRNADAAELATILREQFPRTLSSREGLVIVTPQPGTNSVIVSAPRDLFEKVDALVTNLDAPPEAEASRIVTVTLSQSRAEDVAQSLTAALPKNVKVKVTPVRRTNTLLLTGSDEAVRLVMEQIAKLDETPPKPQTEFRRIDLSHQDGYDLASTLRTLLARRQLGPNEPAPAISTLSPGTTLLVSATPDQLEEIMGIVKELDVARAGKRATEFIPLKFADPEATARALEVFYGQFAREAQTPGARAVSIIANPASKSLVIAAGEAEWPGIRALLEKLDSEEYDTSRRLEIVALKHADAESLARALSDAFSAPLRAELERERARRQPQPRRDNRDDFPDFPTVVLSSKEVVSVTAEPLTNSLVIAGPRDQTERIKAVAEQLDVPAYSQLPEPRIIALKRGPASQVAATLRQLFVDQVDGGRSRPGTLTGRSVLIVGDDKSNVVVVRADDAQFAQIKAMADSLQMEGDRSQVSVRVVRVTNFPVARVLQTVRTTFAPVAQQAGETLTVEIDRTGNNLVVASSERLYTQIKELVVELDALAAPAGGEPGDTGVPGLNQGMLIIDLEHHTPEQMRVTLDQMGLTRAQPADRPGIVAEPVTIVPLTSRRAIAVIAGPQDGAAVQSLVRSLDKQPAFADQHVAIVRLKIAPAGNVAAAVEAMLKPRTQDSQVELAASLAEQVRRLTVHRSEADKANLKVDLTQPISIQPDTQTNSIMLASTEANVIALTQVIELLDKLPVGEAVTIRFFPLQNASAVRLATVIRGIFDQGDRLRTNPGTTIRSQPTSETGKALTGQVAISVDERTNAMIVAGREEAVALVEVMVKQLDSERTTSWIEPRVIKLEHADPVRLAATVRQVLLEGAPASPEAEALQRQIARYRILADGGDPADAQGMIQADRFAPLSTLLVLPESNLRAIIVVGSRANAEAVAEVVKLLDVPAAAADNMVRIFSLRVAAADRVATILRDIFRGQVQTGALLPQDDLVLSSDVRTNALVVSTSARSFAIVEKLIAQLDSEAGGPTVGLTVIPVLTGDVTQLAPRVERLMRDRLEAARRAGGIAGPSDTLSIQADPASRSLIVAASAENVEIIKGLIEALTRNGEALAGAETVEILPIASARVEEVAQAVQALYVEKQNRDRGAEAVRVTADLRLNALIVRGTPADIQAIRVLAERLDGTSVAAVTEIKRIELVKADAAEVVRLLQNVLAGRPIAGGSVVGARKAQVLRFLRGQTAAELAAGSQRPPTDAEISGAIQEQVTLTAELRTNSIVAVAPARLMVLIEALVSDLDTTVAGAREIKVFRLINADAEAMADVLRELFNLRQNGSTLVLIPGRADDTPEPGAPPAGSDDSLYPSLDERQQLAITIDPRTNSLLVSGTPEYLQRVEEVVNELDSIEANEREQLVFELRNAKAAEVAETLKQYFQDQSSTIRSVLGTDRAGSLTRMLEREVTVQGDTPSNRLVVGVSPQYRETVEKLVQELDSTPPQVMIQVLLAEVTIDAEQSWGVDISVGPFGGEMYGVRSLAAGASVVTALGVPNLSVSSSDFELLIRALEAQGRLEVLSRPQILVNNNELARIQVGENVGIVESVERLDNGNTLANVTREDVGIILNVTPTISSDGFVRMDITPTISSLSARTTQVSEDFQAPIITKREIETNVRVRDGETVVIGGLLQTTEEERRTKVPLLGDVPFIGQVFKSSKRTQARTELLVLLTPRVIRGGGDGEVSGMRVMSEREVGRLRQPARILNYMKPLDEQPEPDPMPPTGTGKGSPQEP